MSNDGYNVVVGGGRLAGFADNPRSKWICQKLGIKSSAEGTLTTASSLLGCQSRAACPQEMRQLCDTSTEALRRFDAFVSDHPTLVRRADRVEYEKLKGAALHSVRRQAAYCTRHLTIAHASSTGA